MKKIIITTTITLLMLFAVLHTGSALTYTVEVPEGTKVVYIVGTPTGWSFVEMQRVGLENKFTYNIPGAATGDAYEYCAGPNWKFEETNADGTSKGRSGGGGTDVAEYFKRFYEPTGDKSWVRYMVETPEGTPMVWFSSWKTGGAWPWNLLPMTRIGTGNTFFIDITDAGLGDDYFYCAGPAFWNYEEITAAGLGVSRGGEGSSYDNGRGLNVAAYFKKYYNPETLKEFARYTVQVPSQTNVVYFSSYWSGGSANSWDLVQMQRIGTESKFTIDILNGSLGDDHNYTAGPDWSYEEVNAVNHNGKGLDVVAAFKKYSPNTNILTAKPAGLIIADANQVITATGEFEEISIYNVAGQKIQSEKVKNHFESQPLNPGIYFIQTEKQFGKIVLCQ